jgi:hypothetical protein
MKKGCYLEFLIVVSFLHLLITEAAFSSVKESPEIRQYITNNFELRNQNWGICQNPLNGKVLFANSSGLYEYNGITFRHYPLPEKMNVRSVLVDTRGNIFTGSFEDFGYWIENQNCELSYQSLSTLTSIEKNDEVWRIYELENRIFFQSFTTLYIYDYEKISMIKSPFTMLFVFPLANRFVTQIIDDGLYWFENEEFTFIEGSEIFSSMKIHAVVPYGEAGFLVTTANDGLYLFNNSGFKYLDCEASDFLKHNTCNTALRANDSLYVYGSILNGIILANNEGEILSHYNKGNGLSNNTVLSLSLDNENGLWIGLDDGVNHLQLISPYTHYASTGGTLGTIYALLKKNNKLYIGTNHGLFVADIDTTASTFKLRDLKLIENSQGHVWSLYNYNGKLFCGHNEGTFIVENNSFLKVSEITGGWTIKPWDGLLVEGSYTGIVLFKSDSDNQWTFRNKIEGFIEPVRYIEVDYLGYIWASHHQKGLYRLELNEQKDSVARIDFYPEIEGREAYLNVFEINRRVVFTNGDKLFSYDYVEKEIVPVSSLNDNLGEYSRTRKIIHHEKNLYWFTYENRLALFEITLDFSAIKKIEIIQQSHSLPEGDMHLLMLDQNTLLIPTRECFDLYDLNLHAKQKSLSRLNLESITFFGKDRTIFLCAGMGELIAPSYTNNIMIHFSDASAFSQSRKTYLYRIPEIDLGWVMTNSDNFNYLNLKHGKYTIEIKRGLISEEIFSHPFVIKTPWYLTYQAIVGYIFTGLLLLFLIYRIFRFELSRQKELIQMGTIRENMARELDHRSYELMLTIRYLIHKNEILTELQHEVNDIKENSSKYPVKNLRNMERIISEGLDLQTADWKNAMNNLKLSQQGFYKKLMEQFPNLTINDLRLCSYLRMNFSTKEIARLLNNSPRAVEISRYRLRKKMGLKYNINLTEFLMSETFSDNSTESG